MATMAPGTVVLCGATLAPDSDLFVFTGSLDIQDAIDQESKCDLVVIDLLGVQHFKQDDSLLVYDGSGELAYAGWVTSAKEKLDVSWTQAPHPVLRHTIQATDNHRLANKRRVAAAYTNTTADAVVNDYIANWLSAEGVYAVRNMLTANQSSVETNTTGFGVSGGGVVTLTRDTTQHWQGTASLKVVCDGAASNQGVIVSLLAPKYRANGCYTHSVYLSGPTGAHLTVSLKRTDTFATLANTTVTLLGTGTWQRVALSFTTPDASSMPDGAHGFDLEVTTPTATATTFYVDGLMFEPTPNGSGRSPVTNLFSAFQSDLEGAGAVTGAGFSFLAGTGTTLSLDSSQAAHGAGALKVAMDGGSTFQSVSVNLPAASFTPGGVYTVSAYLRGSPSQSPALRFFWEGNDLIAGNHAIGSTSLVATPTSGGWTRYAVTATMPNPITYTYIGIRLDSGGTAQGITFWLDELQIEAGAAASPWVLGSGGGGATYLAGASLWELGGSSTVQPGATVTSFTSVYAPASDGLDALAKRSDFWWEIDQDRRLWFAPRGMVTSPWTFDGSQDDAPGGSVEVENTNPAYRNRQLVGGGIAKTDAQIETRIGDGNLQTFTMGYPLAQEPTVEVNIAGGGYVAQTVGIGPEGQVESGKDWYWNAGKNEIVQSNSGVKLTNADALRVTYIGQFPFVAQSTDDAEVAILQAAQANSTSGLVEDFISDSTLDSTDVAFEVANANLKRYATAGKILTFSTRQSGLAPGQLLSVDLPIHDLPAGTQMLIESVGVSDAPGFDLLYTVKAIEGPVDSTWAEFFKVLAGRKLTDESAINVGSSQTLVTQVTFTADATPSATFDVTVQACPIFPMTFPITLC